MRRAFFILFFLITLFLTSCSKQPGQYDKFAQCIVNSGAKMYGTWWCPHCNDQKEMFGKSWEIMKDQGGYVECANADRTQTAICTQEGIRSYPTWRFPDGTESTGKKDFYTLAQKTGCSLE